MPLVLGIKLGPYQIQSPLGTGGMGEVYRARDTRLDRAVAVKILPKEFSCDPVRKQRFEQEAKTISSLNHPHICHVPPTSLTLIGELPDALKKDLHRRPCQNTSVLIT